MKLCSLCMSMVVEEPNQTFSRFSEGDKHDSGGLSVSKICRKMENFTHSMSEGSKHFLRYHFHLSFLVNHSAQCSWLTLGMPPQ
jgi:hypothetical protein